jgi:hypothetical protein
MSFKETMRQKAELTNGELIMLWVTIEITLLIAIIATISLFAIR